MWWICYLVHAQDKHQLGGKKKLYPSINRKLYGLPIPTQRSWSRRWSCWCTCIPGRRTWKMKPECSIKDWWSRWHSGAHRGQHNHLFQSKSWAKVKISHTRILRSGFSPSCRWWRRGWSRLPSWPWRTAWRHSFHNKFRILHRISTQIQNSVSIS